MRNKVIAGVVSVVALLSISACGSGSEQDDSPMYHRVFHQQLPDGRSVLCVWTKNFNSGGVSCDWANAR